MVARPTRLSPPAECICLHDADAKLDGFIAIHSTSLGPAAGGCRFWTYKGGDEALADALRLAKGMSYKNALAGLSLGGAKAVLRKPDGDFDRARLFRAFGQAVESLGGLYVTAKDVGTSVEDMRNIAAATRYVAGLPSADQRANGDPFLWTAKGVFESMRAAARFVLDSDLAGLTVAVQGTGEIGADLCRRLSDAGAHLVIADPDPVRRDRIGGLLGAKVVETHEIASVNAEIFAPCGLGGALTPEIVRKLKAKIVCGAANNQLSTPPVADLLMNRGIAYVPDYVVNAGGIISVAAEYLGEDEADVDFRVAKIAPRVTMLLDRAIREGRTPARVADEMAEEILKGARPIAA